MPRTGGGIAIMRKEQARGIGDRDHVVVASLGLVGDAEDDEIDSTMRFPDRFHRRELGGPILYFNSTVTFIDRPFFLSDNKETIVVTYVDCTQKLL